MIFSVETKFHGIRSFLSYIRRETFYRKERFVVKLKGQVSRRHNLGISLEMTWLAFGLLSPS